jgi:hypothetical protein
VTLHGILSEEAVFGTRLPAYVSRIVSNYNSVYYNVLKGKNKIFGENNLKIERRSMQGSFAVKMEEFKFSC